MSTSAVQAPFRASRYTTGAIVLHWATALLVLLQIAGGWALHGLLTNGSALQFNAYQLHKSLGITVLALTLARILWRLFNPPPPEPASVKPLERRVAHVVHMLFYGLLVAIPLSGWLMVTVDPVQIETVLFFVDRLPWPHLPGFEVLSSEARQVLSAWSKDAHAVLSYAAGVLVLLHVAGALKHQLADGRFIGRMTGSAAGDGPRHAYGHATTMIVTLTFVVAMVGSATVARAPERTQTADVPAAQETTVASVAATPEGAEPDGGADAAASAAAGDPARWMVDVANSDLTFTTTFQNREFTGRFTAFSPTIRFDPDGLDESVIEVSIDTTSVTSNDTAITNSQLNGPDGFANDAHGTATFRSDTIVADGDGYLAEGTLTLRDQSVPQTLAFSVDIEGDEATAEGSLTLERMDYGIGSEDASGDWLAPQVTVDVSVVASRAAGGAGGSAVAGEGADSTPGEWSVIAEESAVDFSFGFQGDTVSGTLPDFSATIRFNEDNLDASSVDVTLDLASAAMRGSGVSNSQLRGPDGLAVNEDATATFRSDSIRRAARNGYVADGTLTLRDTSVPVSLPFTLDVEDGVGIATGTVALERSDFGIGESNDPEGETLGPRVNVSIRVVANVPSNEPVTVGATR